MCILELLRRQVSITVTNYKQCEFFRFFIGKEAKSIRNHFKEISRVGWILFRWMGEEVSNRMSYFNSFLLVWFFLKLWELVKWRMSNRDDIWSPYGMCLQSSNPLRCAHGIHRQCWRRKGEYFFLLYKKKSYGFKKVHSGIKTIAFISIYFYLLIKTFPLIQIK